jgi:putative tryptophan/tyrosine transport system substrate-binding protein
VRRREFISAFVGAAVLPFSARAQEPGRTYRIGALIPTGRDTEQGRAFRDELHRSGFVEGQNLAFMWLDSLVGEAELRQRAEELVRFAPDVIVAGPEPPLRVLQALTDTIPLIGMTEDMVAEGLVGSLARPERNTTGISLLSPELDGKRQEILIEALAAVARIATLADAGTTKQRHLDTLRAAAQARGVELAVFLVGGPDQIESSIKAAKASGAQGINFLATPLFSIPGSRTNRMVITGVAELRLAAIYQWPETAHEGGLIGYGPRYSDLYRQRARMVMKVLRGTKPSELPVEQPTKFELAINIKTAKALQITVPSTLLARADEVIE